MQHVCLSMRHTLVVMHHGLSAHHLPRNRMIGGKEKNFKRSYDVSRGGSVGEIDIVLLFFL